MLDHSGTQVREGVTRSASCPGSLRCIYATGFLPEPPPQGKNINGRERQPRSKKGLLSKLLHMLPRGGAALGHNGTDRGASALLTLGAGCTVFPKHGCQGLPVRPPQKVAVGTLKFHLALLG